MFLGIGAIVSGINPEAVPRLWMIAIFLLALGEFVLFYVVSIWRRRIDLSRARQYEQSVQASERGEMFDSDTADQRYECAERRFSKWSDRLEMAGMLLVVLTALSVLLLIL